MGTTSNFVLRDDSNVGTGLRWYRNNCFFNATLQAIFHVPSLIDCMLNSDERHDRCTMCCLRDTFIQTRKCSRPTFPSNLYDLLKRNHGLLLNGQCQDAHNFLLSLLESSNTMQHDPSIECKFASQLISTTVCGKCGNAHSQSDKYSSIPVDIIRATRVNEAFKMFFESESVDKFCEKCKKNVSADKQFKLTNAPTVLCLQLKRFSNESKIENIVEIEHELVIEKQMQMGNVTDLKYKLMAIVCHNGSLNEGHYKTIVSDSDNLYEFDDAFVKKIPFVNVVRSREAYVLFYECNKHMASERILNIHHQSRDPAKDNPSTKSNSHMANNITVSKRVRINDFEEDYIDLGTTNSDSTKNDVQVNSSTKCNTHMANSTLIEEVGSKRVETIDLEEDDIDLDTENDIQVNSGTKCNTHMANSTLIEEVGSKRVETIDLEEDDIDLDTENDFQSTADCDEDHVSDGWIRVEVTDGSDNALQWLSGITNNFGSQDTSVGSNENEDQFSGRRIIDWQHFINQLLACAIMFCKKCEDGEISVTKETRKGLASTFTLSCTNGCKIRKLHSDQINKKDQSKLNEAAALAIVSVGLGYYHLEEFCAILNIPCMSYKTYHRMDEKLQKIWWTMAKRSAEDALHEEIRLAKELNQVDSAGNALITVKADGSWHTRSYGSNFTSLAGCAAIIGARTNKIIYMDVKSKYCHVCKIAQANCTPPNTHECNANYDGPSSGMETAIIVEGFKYCETKGARFNKFIGDGDSNTYKKLRDIRLYKNPFVYIEKFDCLNHLDKNFGKNYIALSTSKKFSAATRNLLTRSIGENISKGVRMAAKHWRETVLIEEEKCRNLEKDCMNAPLHCFGIHDNCAKYFCKKSTTFEAREFVTALKTHGLYLPVLNLCQNHFANKAKSLLAGYENNAAEGYNSLIAKYTGGKRVFNALARSYKGRTAQAAIQYNSEGRSISTFQEFHYKNPQRECVKLENSRKRKILHNAIRDQLKPKKRKKYESRSSKKKKRQYGEGHEDLDFTPTQMEIATNNFLQQLDEGRLSRHTLLKETNGQRNNSRWSEVRQNLLTSSYFGRILKARNRKSYAKIVEDILYHNNQYSHGAEFVHQRLHELDALQIFCNTFSNESIGTCGIFIDAEHSFLGASPFRLCGDEGLVMIKCPNKLYKKSIVESVNKNLIPFWKNVDGQTRVNPKSHWFYEIQGQLHIARKFFSYLVVYLDETEYKIEKIARDDDFWNKEMKDELIFFFKEAMLKELVNSRDEKGMELRQYDETSKTFI